MLKQTPESLATFPSRPTTFLNHPEKGTLPHSCSFRKYDNDIYDFLYLCSHDLRGGAGVKAILDNFQSFEPIEVNWSFYISPDSPDYNKLTEYQKSKFTPDGYYGVLITVADSMEGEELALGDYSIEESWMSFIVAAKAGKSILVDLSQLRPNGSVNDKGLTATGAIGDGSESSNTSSFFAIYDAIANHLSKGDILSFLQLLGTLNATLRRGGQYKNGIITSSMIWTNPNFIDYLAAPIGDIPGSHKKAVKYTQDLASRHDNLLELISEKRNTESVFLEPLLDDDLHANVCEAIYSKPNGTCLINRLNIAQCKKPQDIVDGLVETTLKLCALHVTWREQVGDRANIYLPLEEDRQIGVDILGFANFLAAQEVTYLEFTNALDYVLNGYGFGDEEKDLGYDALDIAKSLCIAYGKSTRVADKYMADRDLPLLDRIHTIEPSQSHAYTCKDLAGFTTARSIFAPMGRKDKRTSDSQKIKVYFHGDVETAVEVGGELHQRFIELWQQMMDTYGRPHAISFDTWLPCTPDWLRWFIPSRIQTAYYQFADTHDQSYLSKKVNGVCDITLNAKEGCSVCGE